jgi:hypothetical protein
MTCGVLCIVFWTHDSNMLTRMYLDGPLTFLILSLYLGESVTTELVTEQTPPVMSLSSNCQASVNVFSQVTVLPLSAVLDLLWSYGRLPHQL